MKCYQKVLLLLGISILLAYFALKKSEIPNGNVIKERMMFEYLYSSSSEDLINNRFSRDVVYMKDREGEEFRFSSNGYVVGYIEDNIPKGKELDIYWFYTCHEIIRSNSMDCLEVVGAGDSDVNYATGLYMGSRQTKFMVLGSIFIFIFILTVIGCILREEKENDI